MSIKELISHFFTPTENNNLRAKALHHDFLTFYLILAFALVVLVKTPLAHLGNVLGFATDISTSKLYELTNQQRQQNGLSAVAYNDKLALAAAAKAQDMFAKNYWDHYAPDGTTPWNFILGAGYQYEFAGENLARNFLFSQNVVDAWMSSPEHQANILRGDFTEVGFAVVNGNLGGEDTTLVVQMFGTPAGVTVAQAQPALPVQQVEASENTQAQALITPTEISPTSAPAPPQNNLILTQQESTPKVNLFPISFNLTFVLLSLLLLVLATDFYFANRFRIIRFHSKNLAHFIFLFTIFLGLLLFISKGVIL